MNKEDQIFDLLERLYIESQDTKKELKEDIWVYLRNTVLRVVMSTVFFLR